MAHDTNEVRGKTHYEICRCVLNDRPERHGDDRHRFPSRPGKMWFREFITEICYDSIAFEVSRSLMTMAAPVLATKLFAPPLRSDLVLRQRLIDQLNAGSQRKLILVAAPAGYGKTTLISSWLHETNIPSVWLSLDEDDNDPIRFFQYFITALQRIVPTLGGDLMGMLQGGQSVATSINLLINEITSHADPFALVLDDLHSIHSQAVLDMVMFLLERMPPQMHLVLLSRTDPPFPLSRLRIRDEIVDIRADQLRFTLDEIAVFLNEIMRLNLSAGDLAAMEARTEGWIASLRLAGLSLPPSSDRSLPTLYTT